MKRIFTGVIALTIILALTLTGCGAVNTTSPSGTNKPTGTTPAPPATSPTSSGSSTLSVNLMNGVTSTAWSKEPGVPDSRILAAINRFSAGLLQRSAGNEGNVLISPLSVFLALAMTLNGANGETRAAMLRTLADQGITADQINEAGRSLMSLMSRNGEKTTLSIANSIWFEQRFQADKSFLQTNADFYKAGAYKLNFRDPAAKEVINGWVKKETHDLIEQIVEKIDPGTVMFLINTVYFVSDWAKPFEKNQTRKMSFQSPTGAVETDFMHRIDKMSYFTGDGVTGVALSYADAQFAYFALMPESGESTAKWLARQDQATLFGSILNLTRQKANFTVELLLPRYKASYEDSLLNELEALGMGIAFKGATADFTLLSENREPGLYITEVKHKTFIRVDEKGTEAAAATSVVIGKSAAGPADIRLTFDKPFLYGILELKTGVPVFVGILNNPVS